MDNNNLQINQGKTLKYLRKKSDYTQQELANKLHITSQAIANYENGKRSIPNYLLLELAKIFQVPVSTLLGLPETTNIPNQTWEKIIKSNIELEDQLNKDFDVHIVGHIPEDAYNELVAFVSYLKHKYGYPKK